MAVNQSGASYPGMDTSCLPRAASQIFTSPGKYLPPVSTPPPMEASCRPSGLKARPRTGAACAGRRRSSRPSAVSQTLISPGVRTPPLAEASRRPSGLKATQDTRSVCPRRQRSSCPVAMSQTLTSPDWPKRPPADASSLPSGLIATQRTGASLAGKVRMSRRPRRRR